MPLNCASRASFSGIARVSQPSSKAPDVGVPWSAERAFSVGLKCPATRSPRYTLPRGGEADETCHCTRSGCNGSNLACARRKRSNRLAADPIVPGSRTGAFPAERCRGYNGDLFLLLQDPSGSNEILRVDENGDILAKIPLPSTQMYHQLRISPSGTLAVSLPHYGRQPITTTFLYGAQGGLKTSFDVPLFNEIAFIGDDLVGVDHTGIVRLTTRSQFVPHAGPLPLVLLDPATPVMAASLPEDRLAIAEIVAGRLQIATMNAVIAGPMVLFAPEIQGFSAHRLKTAGSQWPAPVASNPAGDLYFGISGGKRQEGAPVLQLDGRVYSRSESNVSCLRLAWIPLIMSHSCTQQSW